MKRLILSALLTAYCLTVQSATIAAEQADPFQAEADRQKQAEATAAANARAAQRQKQLETAATPDAERATKMQPRKWFGQWHKQDAKGMCYTPTGNSFASAGP